MVYIITGDKNRGKTERIRMLYQERGGDGFISSKRFSEGVPSGYDIVRLSTGEAMSFAVKGDSIPAGWDEIDTAGSYSFSGKAFRFAESIIDEILVRGIEPVYLDEIGTLELDGRGFSPLLRRVLETERDIFMAVRMNCVQNVIAAFAIENNRIIYVGES
jgi:nucleoside-triphosphatase THEP1